jgi:hypothetical protein
MKDHGTIDKRSLAFGHAIAARLRSHPEHVSRAKATLKRWMATCSPRVKPTLHEWAAALDGPIDVVIDLLTGTDEYSTRLRQSNPFAGVLSSKERTAILRQFQAYDTKSA